MNARLAELRAEVRARWSDYRRGATLLVREASSGVTVDPRDVVTEQVGDLEPAVSRGRLLPEQPLPAAAAGRARRAGSDGRRRALPGRRLLRQRPAGARRGAALRARAGRRGQPQRGELGARERRPQRARRTANSSPPTRAPCSPAIPFAGADAAVIVDPPRKGCGDAFLRAAAAPSRRARSSTCRATPRRRRATSRRWPPPATPACACSPSTCSRRRGTSRRSRR